MFHVHGFLPHPDDPREASDFLIFSVASLDHRLLGDAPDDKAWREVLNDSLTSGIGLCVGLSMDSLRGNAIRPTLQVVADKVRKDRPTAFWILDHKLSEDDVEVAVDRNVAPIDLGSREEGCKFLLRVCQRASGLVRVRM